MSVASDSVSAARVLFLLLPSHSLWNIPQPSSWTWLLKVIFQSPTPRPYRDTLGEVQRPDVRAQRTSSAPLGQSLIGNGPWAGDRVPECDLVLSRRVTPPKKSLPSNTGQCMAIKTTWSRRRWPSLGVSMLAHLFYC